MGVLFYLGEKMTNERRELLLKLGFFPVTDDFWHGAAMPLAAGEFEWAFRMPFNKQKIFPWHEKNLEEKSDDELKQIAADLLLRR